MDYLFKIALIGDEYTGKTSLLVRYIENTFSPQYTTTLGADFLDKTFKKEDLPKISDKLDKNDKITITIWDMAGQQTYRDVAKLYLDGALGIVIVFDVNDHKTFESLDKWIEVSNEICPNTEIIIVGNKDDLERKVSDEELEQYRREGYNLILSSAKEDTNVDNMFEKITQKVFIARNESEEED